MVTKKSSAPKPLVPVPVSTMLAYLYYYIGATALFLVLLNPLSMFLINLFKPSFAAVLPREANLCGPRICRFYTKLALKWPFRWSKWWMTAEHLDKLSDKQQKIYYDEVCHDAEILQALRPKVWVEIMRNYSLVLSCTDEIAEAVRKSNDLFAELLDLALAEQTTIPLLRDYMHYGTLPKEQMNLLVSMVCTEGKNHESGRLCTELCHYIERCGIAKEMLAKIINDDNVLPSVKEAVSKNNEGYLQRIAVKHLYILSSKKDVREWREFCQQNKQIHVYAQQEMSADQYKIFHQCGHHLDSAAIAHLLWHSNGNPKLAEMIFKFEPKFGIQNERINFVLHKYPNLRSILDTVIADTESELRRYIVTHNELHGDLLGHLFDVPSAADLVCDYIAFYPLPDSLQTQMLKLPNASILINLYDLKELAGNTRYHLLPEIRKIAEENNWIPKKE